VSSGQRQQRSGSSVTEPRSSPSTAHDTCDGMTAHVDRHGCCSPVDWPPRRQCASSRAARLCARCRCAGRSPRSTATAASLFARHALGRSASTRPIRDGRIGGTSFQPAAGSPPQRPRSKRPRSCLFLFCGFSLVCSHSCSHARDHTGPAIATHAKLGWKSNEWSAGSGARTTWKQKDKQPSRAAL